MMKLLRTLVVGMVPAVHPAASLAPRAAVRAPGPRWGLALWLVILSATACFSAGCFTVPYTNTTVLSLIPESEETQMGVQAYQEILGEAKVLTGSKWNAIVERCGRRIAAIADRALVEYDREPFEWEFTVIDAPETVNAFALPGGKVAFFSGILPLCKDETGVAVVMGHEIAHALARHGGQRISQQMLLNLGVTVAAALASKDAGTQATVAQVLGAGLNVGVALPFSRSHESESDYMGVIMMAEAGYDPRRAPEFWEGMAALKEQSGSEAPPEFLSTHPSDSRRIDDLNRAMSEALDYYENATGERVERRTETLTSE